MHGKTSSGTCGSFIVRADLVALAPEESWLDVDDAVLRAVESNGGALAGDGCEEAWRRRAVSTSTWATPALLNTHIYFSWLIRSQYTLWIAPSHAEEPKANQNHPTKWTLLSVWHTIMRWRRLWSVSCLREKTKTYDGFSRSQMGKWGVNYWQ